MHIHDTINLDRCELTLPSECTSVLLPSRPHCCRHHSHHHRPRRPPPLLAAFCVSFGMIRTILPWVGASSPRLSECGDVLLPLPARGPGSFGMIVLWVGAWFLLLEKDDKKKKNGSLVIRYERSLECSEARDAPPPVGQYCLRWKILCGENVLCMC